MVEIQDIKQNILKSDINKINTVFLKLNRYNRISPSKYNVLYFNLNKKVITADYTYNINKSDEFFSYDIKCKITKYNNISTNNYDIVFNIDRYVPNKIQNINKTDDIISYNMNIVVPSIFSEITKSTPIYYFNIINENEVLNPLEKYNTLSIKDNILNLLKINENRCNKLSINDYDYKYTINPKNNECYQYDIGLSNDLFSYLINKTSIDKIYSFNITNIYHSSIIYPENPKYIYNIYPYAIAPYYEIPSLKANCVYGIFKNENQKTYTIKNNIIKYFNITALLKNALITEINKSEPLYYFYLFGKKDIVKTISTINPNISTAIFKNNPKYTYSINKTDNLPNYTVNKSNDYLYFTVGYYEQYDYTYLVRKHTPDKSYNINKTDDIISYNINIVVPSIFSEITKSTPIYYFNIINENEVLNPLEKYNTLSIKDNILNLLKINENRCNKLSINDYDYKYTINPKNENIKEYLIRNIFELSYLINKISNPIYSYYIYPSNSKYTYSINKTDNLPNYTVNKSNDYLYFLIRSLTYYNIVPHKTIAFSGILKSRENILTYHLTTYCKYFKCRYGGKEGHPLSKNKVKK